MKRSDVPCFPVLGGALRMAVLLWQDVLKNRSPSFLQKRSRECGYFFTEHGDVLMYGNGKPQRGGGIGKCGEAFNAMAEGMACLLLLGFDKNKIDGVLDRLESDTLENP